LDSHGSDGINVIQAPAGGVRKWGDIFRPSRGFFRFDSIPTTDVVGYYRSLLRSLPGKEGRAGRAISLRLAQSEIAGHRPGDICHVVAVTDDGG
jgi:hypothetical protein